MGEVCPDFGTRADDGVPLWAEGPWTGFITASDVHWHLELHDDRTASADVEQCRRSSESGDGGAGEACPRVGLERGSSGLSGG